MNKKTICCFFLIFLLFKYKRKVKKWIIISLTLLVSGTFLDAQVIEEYPNSRSKNNIYLSTLGADLTIVSINYERFFLLRTKFFLTGELGIGYNAQVDDFEFQGISYLTFPQHFTMNLGKRKNFFEFGIGGTLFIGNDLPNDGTVYYDVYPIIGYRLHPLLSKKVNFRVYSSFPPSFIMSDWETFTFWWFPVGLSLGIGF
jgi:hypothetical protein